MSYPTLSGALAGTPTPAAHRFAYPTYLVRRKVMKLFGGAFHVYGPDGQVLLYSKMKAFKLKEDIRLYTDESMQTEVLSIQARQIVDFSAAYDVFDSQSGQKVGALRRKGLKSLFKDEWVFLDAADNEIGLIKEDSTGLALLRRFVEFISLLFPQKYHAEVGDVPVCTYKQGHNPFVFKLSVDFTPDTQGLLDRRLGLAGAVLLCAIEGRQHG